MKISTNKENYEQKKAQDAAERKRQNQAKKLEAEIEELGKKKEEIEAKLAQPEQFAAEIASGELYAEYEKIQKEIEDKEWAWMEIMD